MNSKKNTDQNQNESDMSQIMNGWFSEVCPMWPGMALSVKIKSLLYSKKSNHQQIDIYQTETHGRMLVLDGIIQLTEKDEFAYQEMLTHVAMFAHPSPKKICVIGGGDGGILRELTKHTIVESIDFCEVDQDVIDVSKTYLPFMSCGFKDPRITTHICDGNDFIKNNPDRYDVILVDSSDPIGPSKSLFEKPFYINLKQALRDGGIIATQGESFFMHKKQVMGLMKIIHGLFPVYGYSYMMVPSYPGGNIGTCLASKGTELIKPNRKMDRDFQDKLKYYTPDIHKASFVLPYFAQDIYPGSKK